VGPAPESERSAAYQIVVAGRLSERMQLAFPELDAHLGDGCTELCGTLIDAGALYGVLDRCRDLHLDLVSLRRVA
jgi:hypothetical protein